MNEVDLKIEWIKKIQTMVFYPTHTPSEIEYDNLFFQFIEDKINHFSWGILFLHLRSLSEKTLSEAQIEDAFHFECFALSVEMLDDLLDQDNEQLNKIPKTQAMILYTEFLIRGLYPLAHKDATGNGLKNLIEALHGERNDVTSLLSTRFTENDYFEKIVKKSTEVFSYLTYCALGKDPLFQAYDTLMRALAQMTQILNDIRGLYNPRKNDLANKTPTLPLIKYIESNPDHHLKNFIKHEQGLLSDADLLEEIESSGAIQYCYFLLSEYKAFIIQHIETHFSMEKLRPLLTYLKLETWYESFENAHQYNSH